MSAVFDYVRDTPTFTAHRWVTDPDGHPARSAYVETYWLPLLGPSALLVIRRLAAWLDAAPSTTVDVAVLAGELGLGCERVQIAVDRLARFGLARLTPAGVEVRTVLPPVPLGCVRKLPLHLRDRAAA